MSMPATARHRFTLDEWHQLIEAGVLRDQHVELLDGEIYEMAPIGPSHQSVVDRLNHLPNTTFGNRAIVRVRGPVPARPRSEPQPDLALLRRQADFYRTAHPEAPNVFLVIEVAETSLDYDHAKLRIYATGGIREVWILDLRGDRIEVYRDAGDTGYRDVTLAERGGAVACLAFPGVTLAVNDLLG